MASPWGKSGRFSLGLVITGTARDRPPLGIITRDLDQDPPVQGRSPRLPLLSFPPEHPVNTLTAKSGLNAAAYLTFWMWNLMFLSWAYLLLLPLLGIELVQATLQGALPTSFSLSLLGLVLIPTAASIAGGKGRFRTWPALLMRLFYGVELPLFGLCLLRLFILRELNPISAGFLVFLAWAMVSFALEIAVGYAAQRPLLATVQLVSQSVVLLLGLYGGTLLLLYVIPSLCGLGYSVITALPSILSFRWLGDFLRELVRYPTILFSITLGGMLLLFSCTLFVILPFAFCHLYTQSWWRIAQAYGKQHGRKGAMAVTGTVAIVATLLFTASVQTPQSQVQAFAQLGLRDQGDVDTALVSRLGEPVTGSADFSAAAVVENLDSIRAGLLNAYLHRYRYLSPQNQVDGLAFFYEETTALRPSIIQALQHFHNYLIAPFLYQGQADDPEVAATVYAQIFDTPIQRGERQAIQAALQATWNRDEVQAGLLNINQQVIPLTLQQVTVTPQGEWGTVEIQERYENPTWQDEEIFYSFALPETAVITGLWLGDDENPRRYPGVVASRGAAQQVYTQEVQRQVDPALLEQVGPRQYRLRVFPVPAQALDNEPGHARMVLRYQVLQTPEGWPLPQLTERRNVFWNRKTVRERQDQPLKARDWDPDYGWFEPTLALAEPTTPTTHQITLEQHRITATPAADLPTAAPIDPSSALAVVIDGSYSMTHHRQELAQSLETLQTLNPGALDVYLTAATGGTPQVLDSLSPQAVATLPFYGTLSLAEMVQQFEDLQATQPHLAQAQADSGDRPPHYTGIILLTDEGSYELETDRPTLAIPPAPLWLVHLGGILPAAYEDSLITALDSSRGGVTTAVETALERLRRDSAAGSELRLVDGYGWQVQPLAPGAPGAATPEADPSFAPLAARQLILYQSRHSAMTQLASLDAVHRLAQAHHIVSPYSSLLALVNDRQREDLAAAEQQDDRFDREVETGEETLTDPSNPVSTNAIPETGTLLGITLGSVLLLGILRRRSRSSLLDP